MNQASGDAVSSLCSACGLCCNGVLFGDVELLPEEDPKQFADKGLVLFRKGKKNCFSQPCACFDGKWCQIYDRRPNRCRTFECLSLKSVQAGRITMSAALDKIAEARRQSDEVSKRVKELGQTDERMPLNRRYAAVMAEPVDLAADDQRIKRRAALMLSAERLAKVLSCNLLG